jgi:hypothetical protein
MEVFLFPSIDLCWVAAALDSSIPSAFTPTFQVIVVYQLTALPTVDPPSSPLTPYSRTDLPTPRRLLTTQLKVHRYCILCGVRLVPHTGPVPLVPGQRLDWQRETRAGK